VPEIVSGLPEHVKVGADSLVAGSFRGNCRCDHYQYNEPYDVGPESPPASSRHRFDISTTTLSITANNARPGWA